LLITQGIGAVLLLGPGLFVASMLYGMHVRRTGTILPGIAIHITGDLAFLHRRVSDTVSLEPGRVDTLRRVLVFDDWGVTYDCICADVRSFGSHCCKPKGVDDC